MSADEPAPAPAPGAVTRLLIAWRQGDAAAPRALFSRVYDELHSLARAQVRRGGGVTLGATGLVHEAYLKLVDRTRIDVKDRGHFFALAARAMRQVLVDHARRRAASKRGGSMPPKALEDVAVPADARTGELLALEEALSQLESLDPHLVRLVELRFFGGLSVEESAEALEVSPRTVKRDWQKARAMLHRALAAMDVRQ